MKRGREGEEIKGRESHQWVETGSVESVGDEVFQPWGWKGG